MSADHSCRGPASALPLQRGHARCVRPRRAVCWLPFMTCPRTSPAASPRARLGFLAAASSGSPAPPFIQRPVIVALIDASHKIPRALPAQGLHLAALAVSFAASCVAPPGPWPPAPLGSARLVATDPASPMGASPNSCVGATVSVVGSGYRAGLVCMGLQQVHVAHLVCDHRTLVLCTKGNPL